MNAGCQWGMITALAKLGSAEQVGRYTLGVAVAAPVMAITMLQLRALQVIDARDEFSFEQYFGTRLLTTAVALIIISGICLLGFDESRTAWIVLLVGMVKGVEAVSDIVRSLFQRHERMDISGTSLMLKGPALLMALIGVYWMTSDLIPAVAAAVAAGLLVMLSHDLPRARRLLEAEQSDEREALLTAGAWNPSHVFRLIGRAWPLGLGMCLLSLQMNIPRYVLQAHHGEALLGYFSAMAYVTVLGTMVVSALGQAASPRLAAFFLTDRSAFRRLFVKLVLVATLLGALYVAAVAVAGGFILTLLYRPEYAAYHAEFVLIAVAGALAFMVTPVGFALTAARVFKAQLWIAGASCVVSIGLASWLIPAGGVRGAAWTLVVMAAFLLVCFAGVLITVMRGRGEPDADSGAGD